MRLQCLKALSSVYSALMGLEDAALTSLYYDLNTLEQLEIRCGKKGDALLTGWWMMSSGGKRKWYLGSDFLSISVLSHPPRRVLHIHLKNKWNNEWVDDRPLLEKRGRPLSVLWCHTQWHPQRVASHHRCSSPNSRCLCLHINGKHAGEPLLFSEKPKPHVSEELKVNHRLYP